MLFAYHDYYDYFIIINKYCFIIIIIIIIMIMVIVGVDGVLLSP